MANFCANILHVVGAPERVEEFRMLNGQFIRPYLEEHQVAKWNLPEKYPEEYPSVALMAPRKYLDISYASSAPIGEPNIDVQIAGWGVKWDVASATWDPEMDLDRAPVDLGFAGKLSRHYCIAFDSPWGPPSAWFGTAAAKFGVPSESDDLFMVMSFAEDGNGIYGLITSTGETEESNKRHLDPAIRKRARLSMPKLRKPGKLWQAIIDDDVSLTRKHLGELDGAGLIDGYWTPLMHAAYCGSEKVFNLLLRELPLAGDVLTFRTPSGVGVVDILLDVFPSQHPDLVKARYRMLDTTLAAYPKLSSEPLASGMMPIELAARFMMIEPLKSIVANNGLECVGTMGGWTKALAGNITPAFVNAIHPKLTPENHELFFQEAARSAQATENIALALCLCDYFDELSDDTKRILNEPPNGKPSGVCAAYQSFCASRAISALAHASCKPIAPQ